MDPIDLYCGNNGAIAQAKELRYHKRFKHILRRYQLIWEIIDIGDVKICIIPTLKNVTNSLIRPFVHYKHDGHTRFMNIICMPDWL